MSLTTTTEPYVPGTIPFSQYLEQHEFLFEHNNYSADKYKISFLAVCGTEVYNQMKLLFPGQNVRDLTYKQITDELKKRYDKKDNDVIHTYKFWIRRQHEKSEDFVLSVKQLAELCGFEDFKDRAIRDALVIGTYDRQLQKRLFDEDDLTAAKAEKLIVNQELSTDRTRFVNRDDDKRVSVVARLGRRLDRGPSRQSFRSRSRSFDRNRSFYNRSRSGSRRNEIHDPDKIFTCSFCHKTGHTKKFCFRLKRKSPKKTPRKNKPFVKFFGSPKPLPSQTSGLFKRLKKDLASDSEDEDLPCMMINARIKVNEPCYVEALVQKTRLTMEIDCGSAESVISEALFLRNFNKCSIENSRQRLYVIDGNRLSILGKARVSVRLNGITEELYLIVLHGDKDFVPLMGRSWLDIFYSGWRDTFSRPVVPNRRVNAMTDVAARDEAVEEIKNFTERPDRFGA